MTCLRHRRYTLASCEDCRRNLLASVQSCTVHAAPRAADLDISDRAAAAILGLVDLDRDLRSA